MLGLKTLFRTRGKTRTHTKREKSGRYRERRGEDRREAALLPEQYYPPYKNSIPFLWVPPGGNSAGRLVAKRGPYFED